MGILTAAVFIVIGIGLTKLVIDPRGFVRDGALLICDNSDRIFLLSQGIRHALPQNIQLAQELGFKLDRLTAVSCEILDQFPEGETVEELLQSDQGIEQIVSGLV